ncbi:UNVERIFIED_CONTAM: hypothetical protein Slati_0804500 [Sesamum latifolium]|uniref:Uncharacterized protein n=1 Tax=Sesamum latifolium TaxID=2727402 RepID=A0AAW2XLH6_9LAMI
MTSSRIFGKLVEEIPFLNSYPKTLRFRGYFQLKAPNDPVVASKVMPVPLLHLGRLNPYKSIYFLGILLA